MYFTVKTITTVEDLELERKGQKKPWKGATDSMDSTLLPMAESFRHTDLDVVSVILASARDRITCEEVNTKMKSILVCIILY